VAKPREGWSIGKESRIISGDISNETFRMLKDENWEPHPLVKEVLLNFIITKKDNEAGVTCLFVKIPKGKEIPEHLHELSNDIIVPLEGKAKIWIKGIGEFEMRRGVVVNVPKGVKHKIFDVTEDVFAFDVFNPGIA
jgi:quercetin dioxygenase-like cupin family protein